MNFADWLSQQVERHDLVGHLAYDAVRDEDLPRHGDLGTYRLYLQEAEACEGARTALEMAIEEFEQAGGVQ